MEILMRFLQVILFIPTVVIKLCWSAILYIIGIVSCPIYFIIYGKWNMMDEIFYHLDDVWDWWIFND